MQQGEGALGAQSRHIRTNPGLDVCDYPDSGVNILPCQEIYFSMVRAGYYAGEDKVTEKWESACGTGRAWPFPWRGPSLMG